MTFLLLSQHMLYPSHHLTFAMRSINLTMPVKMLLIAPVQITCISACCGFTWHGFGSGGGYKGGFCKKLLEASPMSDTANARWF